jgi:starch-binding outer membrane protein, SusD/RagB family
MKTYKYWILFSLVIVVFLAGCESLDVKNENDPDFKTAFSNQSDVLGVASALFNNWYVITQEYDGPALMLWVGADAGTCSWGNAAMYDFSHEPRITWDNTASYPNAINNENIYKKLYANLSSANEVLGKVELGGMTITADDQTDETPMVKAMAYLGQGLSLGYIGLLYDKAFIVTEYTNLGAAVPTAPYKAVIDTAVKCLDKCIAVCASKTFTFPSTWIPGMTMNQTKVGELANTLAAILLSYSPRNKADNDAADWTKILAYANKGLTTDFNVLSDGSSWYSLYHYYANVSSWGRLDMRLVNMMDSRFPSHFVDANSWATFPAATTTHTVGIDDRIFTDFSFQSSCGFKVERGYYEFSCYRFKREDAYVAVYPPVGITSLFLKAENDLLKAEGNLHKPDLAAAAAIINAGTWVTRGHLAPISATTLEVSNAIFHERNIELFCTGLGVEFFTMRKADLLQKGTPLHLPIPGAQLDVNLMAGYTFGGVSTAQQGVPGKDVSNGGWF